MRALTCMKRSASQKMVRVNSSILCRSMAAPKMINNMNTIRHYASNRSSVRIAQGRQRLATSSRPLTHQPVQGRTSSSVSTSRLSFQTPKSFNSARHSSGQILHFTRNGRDVSLFGVGHTSAQTVNDAQNLILQKKPKTLILQLDSVRFRDVDKPFNINQMMARASGGGNLMAGLEQAVQDVQGLFQFMGFAPSAEYANSINAFKQIGANENDIVLADLEVEVTMKNLSQGWNMMEGMSLMKEFSGPTGMDIVQSLKSHRPDQLKTAMSLAQMLNRTVPSVAKHLFHVRGRKLMEAIDNAQPGPVVGVVGLCHFDTIQKLANNQELESGRSSGAAGLFKSLFGAK